MFNSTYGAGFRAGMARPTFKHLRGDLKTIATPRCPFSPWQFISYALWHNGLHDGMLKRLSQPLTRSN